LKKLSRSKKGGGREGGLQKEQTPWLLGLQKKGGGASWVEEEGGGGGSNRKKTNLELQGKKFGSVWERDRRVKGTTKEREVQEKG